MKREICRNILPHYLKFLKRMNCVLQMFVIFIVCRIAVHQMMNTAATTAWTKDGIVGATWNRKLGKLGNKANPKAARGQRRSIFMRDRFAVGSVARKDEWRDGRTNRERRTNKCICTSLAKRELLLRYSVQIQFCRIPWEGELPVVELKWKLAAQTVSRCERRDLRSRLTDNFVGNFAKRDKTRRDTLYYYFINHLQRVFELCTFLFLSLSFSVLLDNAWFFAKTTGIFFYLSIYTQLFIFLW